MKTLINSVLLALFLNAGLAASSSGSQKDPLEGSYPIVLSHGIFGWGDSDGNGTISMLEYWGGMDRYLRSQGATVYAPQKSAANSNEYRAEELKEKLLYYMAANNYDVVHIMGHSMGGLDSRYMISNLGMKDKIASLTTINSPHLGSPIADIIDDVIPDWLKPFVGSVIDGLAGLLYGSGSQESLDGLASLTTDGMADFNSYTPNQSSVDYFSYTSYMTWADPIQHPLLFALQPACAAGGLFEGLGAKNDGLVPYESAKWGTFKGRPDTAWYVTGLDHLQVSNTLYTGQVWFDVEGFYLDMAKNAMNSQ